MWTIFPLLPLMAPGMSPVPIKLCCFPYVIWMWGLRSLQSNRISSLVLVPFHEATLNFWDTGKDTALRGNMPNIHIHLYICYNGKPNAEQKLWLWISLLAATLLSDLVGITGCHLVYKLTIYFSVPQRIQIDLKIISPKALYFITKEKWDRCNWRKQIWKHSAPESP